MPTTPIALVPDARGHLRSAARRAANTVGRQIESAATDFLARHRLESPAEQIFAVWFFAIDRTLQYHFDLIPQANITANGHAYRVDFRVLPADVLALHELGTYRLTFPRLAVEVDGHEWHERTRQQVNHRNRRDRDLQDAGWRLFHFAGGEVVTQPDRCVAEVLRVAYQAWKELLEILYRRKRLTPVLGTETPH